MYEQAAFYGQDEEFLNGKVGSAAQRWTVTRATRAQ
jgi:hypothetical protein